jgi:hypothetical protein
MNWILQHRQVTPDGSQQSADAPLRGTDASQPNTPDHPQEGMPTARNTAYTLNMQGLCIHTHTHKNLLTFVMKARSATDKLHTLLFTEYDQCNESKERTNKHAACMKQIRNTNKTWYRLEWKTGTVKSVLSFLYTLVKSPRNRI